METKCLWLIFRVHRTQVIPSIDPKMYQFVIRMVSKHHACTSFEKVEPALTALSTPNISAHQLVLDELL